MDKQVLEMIGKFEPGFDVICVRGDQPGNLGEINLGELWRWALRDGVVMQEEKGFVGWTIGTKAAAVVVLSTITPSGERDTMSIARPGHTEGPFVYLWLLNGIVVILDVEVDVASLQDAISKGEATLSRGFKT